MGRRSSEEIDNGSSFEGDIEEGDGEDIFSLFNVVR